ncbi:MAG: M20 metallopeptidase family protein [Chloroflexota bacterium]
MQAALAPLKAVNEQVVLDRRRLHAHPELGFEEHETARFVAERLRALGLEPQTGVAGTGVVALISGARPGKTVMLRADMDALPIDELNEVPYRSQKPGVMHACGHDGHTAILLNAARLLVERRAQFAGTIKLIFQPCEEKFPGGAVRMIEEGVLESPHVDAVFGLHLAQDLPLGIVCARSGPAMAAADTFTINITGKGGHGATPELCVDAALIAAQVTVALHALVAREVKPLDPAVITVGSIHAGTAPNIIPQTAVLTGTVRTFNEELRRQLARRIDEVAVGVARAMRADCECVYEWGNPCLVNDVTMTALVTETAKGIVGGKRFTEGEPIMGAEDFSSFLERVPGCFFFVGTRNDARGLIWGHHHPRFDVDEAALPLGIELIVAVAERYLAT